MIAAMSLFSRFMRLLPLWLALAASAAHAQGRPAAVPRTADYILAVVNRELVTAGEIQLRINQLREEARRTGARLPSEDELRTQLLNTLIDERVQVTHAREVGQKVDDNELDRAVGNVAAQNQLTIPQLRERLRTEGIDYNRFRSNIRDQMMVERVREREVQARIRITDAEVDAWLEKQRAASGGNLTITQTRARHILLRPSAKASEEAVMTRMQELKRQIESGAKTFDQLAREVSEDGSAPQGGDLGWVSPGSFVPEFEEAMNALAINALSEPVVSRFGVHLIQVIERRDTKLDAKQQREQARNALREQKYEAANADWLRELRAQAYVEMREAPQSP